MFGRDDGSSGLPLMSNQTPPELIVSKMFIQDRYRYDGADVAHVILRAHDRIDWEHLLRYMEPYWEVLLTHLLNFRFIYPTERDLIPECSGLMGAAAMVQDIMDGECRVLTF